MIKLSEKGVFLASNNEIIAEEHFTGEIKKEEAKKGTIAWSILSSHNTSGNMDKLKIKFDSLASHDITFVGIVQTAKASGMERFPLPYVLTNCHNSLCAAAAPLTVMTMFLVYRRPSVMAVFLCLRILRSSINICVR